MKMTMSRTGKMLVLSLVVAMILPACGGDLWGSYDPYPAPTPTADGTVPVIQSSTLVPSTTPTTVNLPLPTRDSTPTASLPTNTPTAIMATSAPGSTISYTSQSGDSLDVVATHFGVKPSEMTSPQSLPSSGFITPGTLIFIPAQLSQTPTTPSKRIIPDSELVDSPSAVDFNIADYVNSAGGKLSTFHEDMADVGTISGADGVKRISLGSSISPRLLLALIQYYTGWVQGQAKPNLDMEHLFGYANPSYAPAYPSLYQPMRLVVRDLLSGYYGWRSGSLTQITFPDGTTLRIAPDLNAGSVALQYFFSRHLNYADWLQVINPDTGFLSLYKTMFGDPWQRANELGPLFPPNLIQPTFILPFEVGALWAFSGGPHPAWEAESGFGALDFAPAAAVSGCVESKAWAVAVAPGLIVRSENYYVVLDLDWDGFEQTGWDVIYQHIDSKDRIATGTRVNTGDRIGHPSCKGGNATGTNLHIARKYNGEWVNAGDPLPFILSGWTAHYGNAPYQGTLTKGDLTIIASQTGINTSQITRPPDH